MDRAAGREGVQGVGFLGRILLAGRSGPVHRKLVRAASDCEDSRVVLYAGPGADVISDGPIGYRRMTFLRILSFPWVSDTPRGRCQREVQGHMESRLVLEGKKK